jgi:2-oxoisovalerate dehydrogenase E2 component (dihydrolipoyl transacylase)
VPEFLLPELGRNLGACRIVKWHVREGDSVIVDQPLISVETDKAVIELRSPVNGRIARRHAAEGDLINVGEPLVSLR